MAREKLHAHNIAISTPHNIPYNTPYNTQENMRMVNGR